MPILDLNYKFYHLWTMRWLSIINYYLLPNLFYSIYQDGLIHLGIYTIYVSMKNIMKKSVGLLENYDFINYSF